MQEVFKILALDHRSSLKRIFSPESPQETPAEKIINWKEIALRALLPQATHVLTDPQYGLPALKRIGETKTKVILSIEKSGYTETAGERVSQLEYTVPQLKEMGADVIKLLVYYHPQAQTANQQNEIMKKVATDCQDNRVQFLVEPIPYALPGEENFDKEKAILDITESIMQLNLPIDIYKIGYPGQHGCRKMNLVVNCPWVLLSAGVDFADYFAQLSIAQENGASGFAAGRALWKEFAEYSPSEWESFFRTTASSRLTQISQIFL